MPIPATHHIKGIQNAHRTKSGLSRGREHRVWHVLIADPVAAMRGLEEVSGALVSCRTALSPQGIPRYCDPGDKLLDVLQSPS